MWQKQKHSLNNVIHIIVFQVILVQQRFICFAFFHDIYTGIDLEYDYVSAIFVSMYVLTFLFVFLMKY